VLLGCWILSGSVNRLLWRMVGPFILVFIGRIFGTRSFLTRKEKIKSRLEEVNKIILQRPKTAIFILQYLYGMRIIGALGLGMTRLSFSRFMCYEALNCLVWAAVVLTPGYFLGQTLMYFLRGWFRWVWLGLSIIVIVLISLYLRFFYAGKRIKMAKWKADNSYKEKFYFTKTIKLKVHYSRFFCNGGKNKEFTKTLKFYWFWVMMGKKI